MKNKFKNMIDLLDEIEDNINTSIYDFQNRQEYDDMIISMIRKYRIETRKEIENKMK